jgi:predicted RNase H-like HicB family nuclease
VSGYAVIIEQGETSFGAYAPELPGLGVAGDSLEEVERLIREAIPLHIESLRAHGGPRAAAVAGGHDGHSGPGGNDLERL